MGGKLTAAEKENEFVYHEKVPPVSSLPEVKGASLVKGIAFSVMDHEVAGQDIFMKLVPLEAHQASSMYRLVLIYCFNLISIAVSCILPSVMKVCYRQVGYAQ